VNCGGQGKEEKNEVQPLGPPSFFITHLLRSMDTTILKNKKKKRKDEEKTRKGERLGLRYGVVVVQMCFGFCFLFCVRVCLFDETGLDMHYAQRRGEEKAGEIN
jgi:hypothetical protein